jgi:uncharacterized protein with LGFP repeats
MSTIVLVRFDGGVLSCDGSTAPTATPASVSTAPLGSAHTLHDLSPEVTDVWSAASGSAPVLVDLDQVASAYTEFALELWVGHVADNAFGTLISGNGCPATITVDSRIGGGLVRITATVETDQSPLVLEADVPSLIADPNGAPGYLIRVGVFVSGHEAVLAYDGTAVQRRRRDTMTVVDARGPLMLGSQPDGAEPFSGSIAALRLADELTPSMVDVIDTAADSGLGEIASLYEALGGATSILGTPLDGETINGGIRHRTFTGGAIYWSLETGAHAVTGEIKSTHDARGGILGRLGLPTGDADVLTNILPMALVPFDSSGIGLIDLVANTHDLVVQPPDSIVEIDHLDDSIVTIDKNPFVGGGFIRNDTLIAAISTLQSATAERSANVDQLVALLGDAAKYEGELHLVDANNTGYVLLAPRAQMFQHGIVVNTAGAGGCDFYDEILAHWLLQGASSGKLGLPREPERLISTGSSARFGGGTVYWSQKTGAHAVRGKLLKLYESLKGPSGWLGFPTEDQRRVRGIAGAEFVHFQHGCIVWSASSGAHAMSGDIYKHFLANGGFSAYGLPLADLVTVKGNGVSVDYQEFSDGLIAFAAGVGAFDTMEVKIDKVATGNIDDGLEWIGIDTSAELYVIGRVFDTGAEVLSERTGSGGRVQQLSWPKPTIRLTSSTVIRLLVEAWDTDSNANDKLAELDVSYGLNDDFFGFLKSAGSFADHPSTSNVSEHADPTAVTFDFTIAPQFAVSLRDMREKLSWKWENGKTQYLPWSLYKEVFVDVTGSDVDYFTGPLESWYFETFFRHVAEGGNCFGFANTEINAFAGFGPFPQPLAIQPRNNEAWEEINRLQGSQLAASVLIHKTTSLSSSNHTDPRRVYDRVAASIATNGMPVKLSIWRPEASHAIAAYECVTDGADKVIYVADSNLTYSEDSRRESSKITIHPDGSFEVEENSNYNTGPWNKDVRSERGMTEMPHSVIAAPLRTPLWDIGTYLGVLLGGLIMADGASVDQIESDGRKLFGDNRGYLANLFELQADRAHLLADAGLASVVVHDRGATDDGLVIGARNTGRLVGLVNLLGVDDEAQAVRPAALNELASRLAQVDAIRESWGGITIAGEEDIAELRRPLPKWLNDDVAGIITPGVWPELSRIQLADASPDLPTLFAHRGPLSRGVTATLHGEGREFAYAVVARGGLVQIAGSLAKSSRLIADSIAPSSARPGISVRGTGLADGLSVRIDGARSVPAWHARLGVGDEAASARVTTGRPGLALQHSAALSGAQFSVTLDGASRSYTVPSAQAGEGVRIIANDPASPLGAIRLQSLSVLGDVLSSVLIDPA